LAQWEQFGKKRNEEERRKREKNERNGLHSPAFSWKALVASPLTTPVRSINPAQLQLR
jgi:hypothetical protein